MTTNTVIVHHPIPDHLRHHLQQAGYTPATSTDHTTIYTNHAPANTTPRPARAALYRADAETLLHSGLDLDGARLDPEGDGEAMLSPLVFMTRTAWSFVAFHRASEPLRPCRPRALAPVCQQLRLQTCQQVDRLGQPPVGEAICPDCYDYWAAVTFNATAGELSQRILIAADHQLAGRADVPVRAFDAHWRMSCVRLVEFRASGVVHLQALVRLDQIDRSDANPASSDADDLDAAAAAQAPTPNPLHSDRAIRWGTQADVEMIDVGSRRKTMVYLAKYATKSEVGAGLLDRRLHSENVDHLDLPDRVKGMVQVAWDLSGRPELKRLNLRAWPHSFGWRGHRLTRSAHWSTTSAQMRASRQTWPLKQLGTNPEEAAARRGEWDYERSGYLNAGYAWLAAKANRAAKLNRRTAWDDI